MMFDAKLLNEQEHLSKFLICIYTTLYSDQWCLMSRFQALTTLYLAQLDVKIPNVH